MITMEKQRYINLTDLEVRGLLNGNLTQVMRRAKIADAFGPQQVQPELDVLGAGGDIIFGREAWRIIGTYPDNAQVQVEYRAGGRNYFDGVPDFGKYMFMHRDKDWRPAQHIPKFAVRIAFEVIRVHVERLHDLQEEDARQLGMEPLYEGWDVPWKDYELKTLNGEESAKDSYFSWYRYNHGRTNFTANDWQLRAEVKLIDSKHIQL